ncbi:MAG TPA: MFS transporter [Rubrobacter sp.]|nr:MFS transporter [Rubrobacter sp.]HKH57691.1 MFS transporter [Rubrobacter sp.]
MSARKHLALFLLCLASFIAVVDTTIITIALPSMRRELGFSGADAQWILNGYALTFGGLVLLLGRAGDLYGRRRLFEVGLALFAAASLVGGFAWEPWILVCARFIQGVGAAALVPASLSLLTASFAEGEERNRAIGIYGAMAALGFVVGMVGGGVITQFLGWRWVLFVNVPVALVALVPAPAVLPESRNERATRSLDLAGALTATAGLGLLIYAISEVPENGWMSTATLGFGTLGTLLMACFVVAERRSSAPLVPLGVLKKRAVVVPNAAIFLQSMVGIAWLYVLTLYLQEVLGHSALTAGLLFIPMTLASVLAAPVAGRLATRLGLRMTAAWGLALVAAGLLLMTPMSVGGGLVFVLLGMVVGEIGFMFSNVPLTIAGSGGTGERGLAAGLLNTSIQLGNAWGLGVVATVVAAASAALGGEAGGSEALVGGLRWGLYACVGFAMLAFPVVLKGLPRSVASTD